LPPPIAAPPSWPRFRRHCAIRISSRAGCSRIAWQASGATMPALPLPIDPQFRDDPGVVKKVPKLGER
jgi:hypothetical protein